MTRTRLRPRRTHGHTHGHAHTHTHTHTHAHAHTRECARTHNARTQTNARRTEKFSSVCAGEAQESYEAKEAYYEAKEAYSACAGEAQESYEAKEAYTYGKRTGTHEYSHECSPQCHSLLGSRV